MSDRITSSEHEFRRKVFEARLAKETGLHPATVHGWVAAENGPWNNPLGLNILQGATYPNPIAAAHAVATLVNTSGMYRNITGAARRNYGNVGAEVSAEATAIAASPWVTGKPRDPRADTGAGQYFRNIVTNAARQLLPGSKIVVDGKVVDAGSVGQRAGDWVKDKTGLDEVEDAANSAVDAVSQVGDILGWVTKNPGRIVQVFGGLILLLVAIILIARR